MNKLDNTNFYKTEAENVKQNKTNEQIRQHKLLQNRS